MHPQRVPKSKSGPAGQLSQPAEKPSLCGSLPFLDLHEEGGASCRRAGAPSDPSWRTSDVQRWGRRDSPRGRNVQRFRGGLVFKAHRLLYHATLGSRVIKKKKKAGGSLLAHLIGHLSPRGFPPHRHGRPSDAPRTRRKKDRKELVWVAALRLISCGRSPLLRSRAEQGLSPLPPTPLLIDLRNRRYLLT